MPFAIGKAFSDETLALLQRQKEAETDARAKGYALELQRHAMLAGERQSNREMNLKDAALAGEGEDRAARLEMARASRALDERKLNLDASQSDRAFGQHKSEFDVEKEMKGKQLDLSGREQDWRELAGTADIENRNRSLDLTDA